MDIPQRIYRVRQKIDPLRQPRYLEDLQELDLVLQETGAPCPYLECLGRDHFQALRKNERFSRLSTKVCKGQIGETSNSIYLYRTIGVRSLITHTDWKYSPRGVTLDEFKGKEDPDLLAGIKTQYDKKEMKWVPLSDYCRGVLSGYRKITWWTDLDLSEDTARRVLRIGLRSPPSFPLVLRCSSSQIKHLTRVPTAMDGFDQLIFQTTRANEQTRQGKAISLERLDDLAEGADEFVLESIAVEAIDMCLIPREFHSQISLDDLLEPLEGYYRRLGG